MYFRNLNNLCKCMKHKRIALVAHDNKKKELVEWAVHNREVMSKLELFATGTTAKLLQMNLDMPVKALQSGPLGGDQQIGAMITEGAVDILIFFWDPLQPLPHDPDIKALLRLAVLWNIPLACNKTTADFLFTSNLLFSDYERKIPQFKEHLERKT
jgi:methylglyoxal synthase